MLKSLEPSAKRRLFRRVATTMRRQHRERIRSQKNPDGSAFAPRKAPIRPQEGNFAVKFLYPSGGSGPPRLVLMKSWVKQGPIFTGYDRKVGGLRSFEYAKVIKWLRVDPADENTSGGRIRERRTIRRGEMFRKMHRKLYPGQSDHEAWIGFGGMVASVAAIHQFGLKDKPARHAREVRYARRELLGMTAKEREELLDTVIEHMMAD